MRHFQIINTTLWCACVRFGRGHAIKLCSSCGSRLSSCAHRLLQYLHRSYDLEAHSLRLWRVSKCLREMCMRRDLLTFMLDQMSQQSTQSTCQKLCYRNVTIASGIRLPFSYFFIFVLHLFVPFCSFPLSFHSCRLLASFLVIIQSLL